MTGHPTVAAHREVWSAVQCHQQWFKPSAISLHGKNKENIKYCKKWMN